MRQQFCTNNNSIYWYNLLNINNNLSTRYYYLAHLILAKTIHTLFFRCESPSQIMFTSRSHISNYPRIPCRMRQCLLYAWSREISFNPRIPCRMRPCIFDYGFCFFRSFNPRIPYRKWRLKTELGSVLSAAFITHSTGMRRMQRWVV